MSQKDNEESHVHHRYNLLPRPNLVKATVSPVRIQPPRVHPSLTRATISPNSTHLRSRVTIVNYDIDPSIIPSIKVKSSQRKYAHGLLQQTMRFRCGNCKRQCMSISLTRALLDQSLTMKPVNLSIFVTSSRWTSTATYG